MRSLISFIENSHRDLVFKATVGIQSGFETEELHVIQRKRCQYTSKLVQGFCQECTVLQSQTCRIRWVAA